jgi:RimJ/RimL family protein N-acetyltransferase
MGFGGWVIEDKRTGAFIGECGFADFRRDIDRSMRGDPEIGWVLAPHAQRKGYAIEAIRAAVRWGDLHLPSHRTVCLVDRNNSPSIRVAQRAGYAEFRRLIFRHTPVICFERYRPGSTEGSCESAAPA